VRSNKKKRRRPSSPGSRKPVMLERFTERDLEIWEARTADLQSYYDRAYFDLERQRASHYDDLCATLREVQLSVSL